MHCWSYRFIGRINPNPPPPPLLLLVEILLLLRSWSSRTSALRQSISSIPKEHKKRGKSKKKKNLFPLLQQYSSSKVGNLKIKRNRLSKLKRVKIPTTLFSPLLRTQARKPGFSPLTMQMWATLTLSLSLRVYSLYTLGSLALKYGQVLIKYNRLRTSYVFWKTFKITKDFHSWLRNSNSSFIF